MRSFSRSFSFVAVLLLMGLLLTGSPGLAQGDRSSMTLNEAGQVLRFIGTHDDIPTALIDTNGSEASVLSIEDLIGGDEVVGMGAIADLNDSGVAVIQVDLGTADLTDPDNPNFAATENDGNQVLITSSGGAPTVIVVAKNDGLGDVFGDDTLCHIGPMPEINNAGRVAYFGHLDIDGSGLAGRDCEESQFPRFTSDPNFGGSTVSAWDEAWEAFNGGTNHLIVDVNTNVVTRLGGPFGPVGGNVKSAVFRYGAGSGNEKLLTGSWTGFEADMLSVSDSRWVSAPTDFLVSEVDIIRDAERKLTSNGAIGAFATLATETFTVPGGLVDEAACSNPVINATQDNPFDDPDGSDPFTRYTMTCPEVNVGAEPLGDGPLLRETIIILSGGTRQVVAVTGPPGESDYQYFEYNQTRGSQGQFVMNDAGQLLFKATIGQEDDPNDLRGMATDCGYHLGQCFVTEYRLELYQPGGAISTIVKTGDPVPTPGSNAAFCDFAPHFGLADDGSFAFHATLAGDGTCEFEDGTQGEIDTGDNRGTTPEPDGLFYYSNGVITELFRTQLAADSDTGPGPFTSSWSGNEIDEIGSVAVVEAPGLVQFFVENADYAPDFCPQVVRGSDTDFGGGEWTAVLSWTEDSGLESILEEGELLGTDADDYIFRIHAVGPKLRNQGNASAELVALLEIDRNEDCDTTDEEDDGDRDVIVVTQGTPPVGILAIPVGGPWALGAFASILVLLSLVFVRSRGSLS